MEQSRGRRGYDPQLARAVGQTIKVLRTDEAIERKELAQRAGISYSYLAEIERGNKPASNTVLGMIAEQLGLQLHELLADAEARLQDRPGGRSDTEPSGPHSPSPTRPPSSGVSRYPGTPSARRGRALGRFAGSIPEDAVYPDQRPSQDQGRLLDDDEILWELRSLLQRLSPEDRQRIVDLARRLAR